jgi:pyroglutamyl-peptidase
MKALVTGFDPFGGDAVNPSYEAARRLPARIGTLDVVTAELSTSFARAPRQLRALAAREQPNIVLCVGLAADRRVISVERVAVNLDDARLPDNDGAQPMDKPVLRGGPAAYFSSLPVRKIVTRLAAEKIPCELSMSAGTFVCNHVFYALMHLAAQQKQRFRAGFVHVPALPQQGDPGTMSRDQIVHALSLILDITHRVR